MVPGSTQETRKADIEITQLRCAASALRRGEPEDADVPALLGTAPRSRALGLLRKQGWIPRGLARKP